MFSPSTVESLGSNMLSVSGENGGVYSVFSEDLQDCVPRDLCLPTWAGDENNS